VNFPNDFVAQEARAADLLVVGQTPAAAYRFLETGSLLLNAGRPVLVVPKDVASLVARRVVVAWKDTRESRRAIRDALPFLRLAESVFLVEVAAWGADANALPRLKDVGRFLAQHQISNVTERVLPDEPIAGDVLLRFAQEQFADLIVSGAYGHSRLGEWIFGGVTRELLIHSPVCCLFSH
jgi:nucleotide-binding universal stress UspA family protein